MQYMFVAIVIVLILLWLWLGRGTHVSITASNGQSYNVVRDMPNRRAAAELLATTNDNLLRFLAYLRAKYLAGPPRTERARIVAAILRNYNFEAVRENDPRATNTSYTLEKGKVIALCLRHKTAPYDFVDPQILMFCMLHEVGGHIGNYNGWNHTMRFWSIFKFVLSEAVAAGVYVPVDYSIAPVLYCGIKVDYQPLYDISLPKI